MSRKRRFPASVNIDVESYDDQGFGIGHFEERECKIKAAIVGENIDARIVSKRKGIFYAIAESVKTPSNQRTISHCENYPRCGGCTLLHLEYSNQLKFKENLLVNALEAQNIQYKKLAEPVSKQQVGYRRRARLGVRWTNLKQQCFIGFRESFGGYIMDMQSCPILSRNIGQQIGPLRMLVSKLDCRSTMPQIEVASSDENTALIFRHLEPLSTVDQEALIAFGKRHDLWIYTQNKGYESVCRIYPEARLELDFLTYSNREFGVNFDFAPFDFVQVHGAVNLALVSDVVSELNIQSGDRIIDLFCGLGNITLPLATRCSSVGGIELSSTSVERARHNASKNDLQADFFEGNLYESPFSDFLPKALRNPNKLVIDPPRLGIGQKLVEDIRGVERLVYVSCSPESFSKDAASIIKKGFALERVGIYDMFPQTAHIEIMGVFQSV